MGPDEQVCLDIRELNKFSLDKCLSAKWVSAEWHGALFSFMCVYIYIYIHTYIHTYRQTDRQTDYEESIVDKFKSNLLLLIFWLNIINYNS